MDKAFVAQGVANKLFATEKAIDQAIADASLLVAEMVQARQMLNVSAVLGDESMAKTAKAIATLAEARSAIVAVHHELEETKLRLGIRTKLAGTGEKSSASLTGTPLRQVG
jgi:hypothetical protein